MILPVTGKHQKNPTNDSPHFRSGELARLAGISPDTLRFYEKKGLLPKPSRTPSGYRIYTADAIARLRMIRSALALGFTIAELAAVFKIRNNGGNPCHEVLRIATAKISELGRRIAELRKAKRELQTRAREWNETLLHIENGKRAHLLEQMPAVEGSSPMSPPGLKKNRRMKNG